MLKLGIISILYTNLWEIPVIQSNNRSDLVLQQMVNQFIIVLYSFFIYMVSCKWHQSVHKSCEQIQSCLLV